MFLLLALLPALQVEAVGPEVFTLVLPGVGHTMGAQGSFWLTDLTAMAQGCGDDPWGSPGAGCWWELEVGFYRKDGKFAAVSFGDEAFDGVPELKLIEDVIGSMGEQGSGCLVLRAAAPFFAVARSYNAANPAGEFGFLVEPSTPLTERVRYLWPIDGRGRGNCFAYNGGYLYPELRVTRGGEIVETYQLKPGCSLITDFEFGDVLTIIGKGDVYLGCSAMADGTSDGTAVKLIEEYENGG
jgi:hypothetical protein